MPDTSPIVKIYQVYNKIIEVLSVLVLILLTIAVFVSVASRYVFEAPLEWSEEISRYAFIWIVFLGFAIAEKSGEHFRIEYFANKLPVKIRFFVEIILNILILGALCMLLVEGIRYYNQGKSGRSSVIQMPLNYIYIALPVSVVLVILNRIDTAVRTLTGLYRTMRKRPAATTAEKSPVH